MFNPFAPLTPLLLQAFVNAGKKYFVRQTFSRAQDHLDEGIKGYFIFTHYSEAGHAQHHLGAISHNPYGFMHNWKDPGHQSKLLLAASQPAGYKIYSAVFEQDWHKRLTIALKQKAKFYIEYTLRWQPAHGEKVSFDIYVNYGELYAKLICNSQEVRVKLEEIENLK